MGTGVDVEALNDALPTVGFAKLCVMSNGDDPANGETYIVQKYEIILGRQSKSSQVDVVLGTACTSPTNKTCRDEEYGKLKCITYRLDDNDTSFFYSVHVHLFDTIVFPKLSWL